MCQIELSRPTFKLITKPVGILKGFEILHKCMPFYCLLSVVFCWCHCYRRPYQKHSWSERNGKVFYYNISLLHKAVCWFTLLHNCDCSTACSDLRSAMTPPGLVSCFLQVSFHLLPHPMDPSPQLTFAV